MRPNHLPPDIHWPTDEEEATINRGIALDPDNPEWTAADFAAARPAREMMPPELYADLRRLAEG